MINSQPVYSESLSEKISSSAKAVWQWITGRQLEAEHLLVVAVIVLSTWHVGHYMNNAEGHWLIAAVMGAVLGSCNALFAMRFFEDEGQTRKPALVGMLVFAGVSIWLQYGFYAENHGVTNYLIYSVNINALVQGAWAPTAEMLIGWLYGKRLQKSRGSQTEADKVRSAMQKKIDELTVKLTGQLTVEQGVRDDLYRAKIDSQTQVSKLQSLIDEWQSKYGILQSKFDKLTEEFNGLRVNNASLSATVSAAKLTSGNANNRGVNKVSIDSRLTVENRRQIIAQAKANEPDILIARLMELTGASRNTIKEDLKALGLYDAQR